MKHARIEMLVVERDGAVCLASPEVGRFTCAVHQGAYLAPGEAAGLLTALGRSFELVVPEGASGMVANAPPEPVLAPVGYGDVLYRLAPIEGAARSAAGATASVGRNEGELVVRAPQSGRVYHRPAPGEPPFVSAGDVVTEGRPLAMLEVMKTFSHVNYRAGGGLPARARIVRWRVKDGADVKSGEALIEVERAE